MKRFYLSIILAIVIPLNTFAYNLTSQDRSLVNTVSEKITKLPKFKQTRTVSTLKKALKTIKNDRTKTLIEETLAKVVVLQKSIKEKDAIGCIFECSDSEEGVLASTTESYPINLLNNQFYKIKVTGEKEDYSNNQPIFEVSRDGGQFNVKSSRLNLDTGEVKDDSRDTSDDMYYAHFEQTSDTKEEVLNIERCFYYYKYIKEGFTCYEYKIPLNITTNNIDWLYQYYSEDSKYNYDEKHKYTIEVIQKNKQEVNCNVRAKTVDKKKIYYTEKSKDYYNLRTFSCFEDEKSAQEKGYTLNYLETQQ